MKKSTVKGVVLSLAILLAILVTPVFAVLSTFTAEQTVANIPTSTIPAITFSGGADVVNGTIPAITLSGGLDEVKASRTLTVNSLPEEGNSIIIGRCTVTFSNYAGDDNDQVNCDSNSAQIDITTATGGVGTLRTAAQVASILRTLSNVSDTNRGALTVGGGGTTVSFTTIANETSATDINFLDITDAKISSTVNTFGFVE